jgi:hypothetical protein
MGRKLSAAELDARRSTDGVLPTDSLPGGCVDHVSAVVAELTGEHPVCRTAREEQTHEHDHGVHRNARPTRRDLRELRQQVIAHRCRLVPPVAAVPGDGQELPVGQFRLDES